MNAQPGDKVKFKSVAQRGKRGVIEEVVGATLFVRIPKCERLVQVDNSDVTNFSLAARRAWKKMPHRRVGRPKGSKTTDRISVTLRFDRDLWERFRLAEANGLVEDRTATINAWVAAKLAELDR